MGTEYETALQGRQAMWAAFARWMELRPKSQARAEAIADIMKIHRLTVEQVVALAVKLNQDDAAAALRALEEVK
jgi:hypothetical protein